LGVVAGHGLSGGSFAMDCTRLKHRRPVWLLALAAAMACGCQTVKTPEEKIAPVIDIMEALKRSLEARKGPKVATAAAGQSIELSADEVEAQPKSKRARKVRTA